MSLLDKAIKLKQKEFKIKGKLLMPKGRTAYLIKRSGRTQKWVIYAIFENFEPGVDRFRNANTFEFAVADKDLFKVGDNYFTMAQIAQIVTHIATVDADGFSVVHGIANGDEDKPQQMEFTWRFFTRQVGDKFDPLNL